LNTVVDVVDVVVVVVLVVVVVVFVVVVVVLVVVVVFSTHLPTRHWQSLARPPSQAGMASEMLE
jgi:hypothetical protein